MTDVLLSFSEWLAATPWSIALHESFYVYPLIESAHVLALCLFVGTLVMVDLRLLGLSFNQSAVSELTAKILPWTVIGFVIMTITGLLLYYAIPVRTYHSVWFRIKIVFLVIAGINAWRFHRRIKTVGLDWDRDPKPPRSAQISGAVSLALWAGIIVSGRLIAYNWFDCDKPQSAFIAWAASCVSEFPQ